MWLLVIELCYFCYFTTSKGLIIAERTPLGENSLQKLPTLHKKFLEERKSVWLIIFAHYFTDKSFKLFHFEVSLMILNREQFMEIKT